MERKKIMIRMTVPNHPNQTHIVDTDWLNFLADFETKQSTRYDDSGSDSGDQFHPAKYPDSKEEDDLEDNVEAESEDEHTKSESTKAKSKIGNLKPGHKDIIATRKTHATVGTPLTGTTIVKSGPHEPTTPPKKKAQKNIAGIFIDWESHRKPTLLATSSIDADEDSMVKQDGMVSDDECDDAEHEVIAKGPILLQKGSKGRLVSQCFNHILNLITW